MGHFDLLDDTYAPLSTSPVEVMASGVTVTFDQSDVVFRTEVSELQPAGIMKQLFVTLSFQPSKFSAASASTSVSKSDLVTVQIVQLLRQLSNGHTCISLCKNYLNRQRRSSATHPQSAHLHLVLKLLSYIKHCSCVRFLQRTHLHLAAQELLEPVYVQ